MCVISLMVCAHKSRISVTARSITCVYNVRQTKEYWTKLNRAMWCIIRIIFISAFPNMKIQRNVCFNWKARARAYIKKNIIYTHEVLVIRTPDEFVYTIFVKFKLIIIIKRKTVVRLIYFWDEHIHGQNKQSRIWRSWHYMGHEHKVNEINIEKWNIVLFINRRLSKRAACTVWKVCN